jgi:hypothetical protein
MNQHQPSQPPDKTKSANQHTSAQHNQPRHQPDAPLLYAAIGLPDQVEARECAANASFG